VDGNLRGLATFNAGFPSFDVTVVLGMPVDTPQRSNEMLHPGHSAGSPRLVGAYSRFVLVGADGVRLHEEVLHAGGWAPVAPGELVVFVGSAWHVAIVVNAGSAAEALSVTQGQLVRVINHSEGSGRP
jgi:hypothetical protein